MKKISVLVPCYNEEQVLPLFVQAIQPILADKRYEWEVLLVDDGSTDNTLSVMRSANSKILEQLHIQKKQEQ